VTFFFWSSFFIFFSLSSLPFVLSFFPRYSGFFFVVPRRTPRFVHRRPLLSTPTSIDEVYLLTIWLVLTALSKRTAILPSPKCALLRGK